MAKKGRRAKGKAPAPSSPKCDLPGCDEDAPVAITCCGNRMCGRCCFSALTVCTCDYHRETTIIPSPKFAFNCAFCRTRLIVCAAVVKDMMFRFCPSHAKVLQNRCSEEPAVLAHLPCPDGCYGCYQSEIRVSDL